MIDFSSISFYSSLSKKHASNSSPPRNNSLLVRVATPHSLLIHPFCDFQSSVFCWAFQDSAPPARCFSIVSPNSVELSRCRTCNDRYRIHTVGRGLQFNGWRVGCLVESKTPPFRLGRNSITFIRNPIPDPVGGVEPRGRSVCCCCC